MIVRFDTQLLLGVPGERQAHRAHELLRSFIVEAMMNGDRAVRASPAERVTVRETVGFEPMHALLGLRRA